LPVEHCDHESEGRPLSVEQGLDRRGSRIRPEPAYTGSRAATVKLILTVMSVGKRGGDEKRRVGWVGLRLVGLECGGH
jgi:hypothetical protein